MRNMVLSMALLVAFTSFSSATFEAVIKAIQTGDAAQVAKYFDNPVEISLPGKSNSYDKIHGEAILREFFSTHEVTDFEVLHKSENAGSKYCIGNLKTLNGNFRTTIFMQEKGGTDVVQEIRFEQ
jgi:hypothetical protein